MHTLETINLMYESLQSHYGRLISLALPCPGVSLAGFLRQHRGQPRFSYATGREPVAFAGAGAVLELTGWGPQRFQHLQRSAAALFNDWLALTDAPAAAAPRLFGGFAFLDDFTPDYAWADFTPAHFILPHYQLTHTGDDTWLTLNAQVPYGDNPHDLRDDLLAALAEKIDALRRAEAAPPPPDVPLPPPELVYPLPYAAWESMITGATARMQRGELNKAVLARVGEARFSAPLQPDTLLPGLAAAYPDTYRFLFEPRPQRAFFGATPELLAAVEGDQVVTMALAGSSRRGTTPPEDAALGQALLHDAKNRYEHDLVIRGIEARLRPLTSALHTGSTGLMTLPNIHHLHTPIRGTLRAAGGIVPLVAALHPTPALGGDPREVALPLIAGAEPVPRGWYAAPVGWIDARLNGQFVVAIRSAVAQAERVWLYAGAGIVADSDPRQEWDETALKFRPMLNALCG
ncbi:MAG: isochorismate synthase [Anaerolineae bacterium]|jgi:menaquinone-specific isochorismate synthase|nr:isochorismate synthase [Anaerolineae bacterium]